MPPHAERACFDAAPTRLAVRLEPRTRSPISCGACVSECSVEAIFDEDDLPARWAGHAAINAELFAVKRPG